MLLLVVLMVMAALAAVVLVGLVLRTTLTRITPASFLISREASYWVRRPFPERDNGICREFV